MEKERILGLKRGLVQLQEYSEEWPKLFEMEERTLIENLDDEVIAIEHIGSTAIPGAYSKPIIDITIGVRRLDDWKKLKPKFIEVGYEYMPDRIFETRAFFAKGPRHNRTHYVHIVEYEGNEWNNTINFRNELRKQPELIEKYNQLKKFLAKKYPNARESYTAGKDVFIKSVIEKS